MFGLAYATFVEIQSSPSALIGSSMNFTATVYEEKGKIAENDNYRYTFSIKDNPAVPTSVRNYINFEANISVGYFLYPLR